MNRILFATAFVLGLLALLWIGAGFVGTSAIALTMTVAMAAVYLVGADELRRFRALSASLAPALAVLPGPQEPLEGWLAHLPAALRTPLRARIESGRGALPGLALTPYLIGLLVMLGMLGTFLGLVVTFRGAVFTLEGSSDLQAIRSALAEPIKGLGLAFGTSVAGVAASAMLGLMSAISRRERGALVRRFDELAGTALRPFSLAHQRQAGLAHLQQQAAAVPALVEQLQALVAQVERRGEQLDAQLLERQALFHREAAAAYSDLGASVARSLHESLTASARQAGEILQPVVENAMAAIAQASTREHERAQATLQARFGGLADRFDAGATRALDGWTLALQRHAEHSQQQLGGLERALHGFTSGFEQRSDALFTGVHDTLARAQAEQAAIEQQRQLVWRTELADLRREETARSEASAQRLLETASEAPRAAADVIAQLRRETTRLGERDNLALQERSEVMSAITGLLHSAQQASGEQRAAIESLVASASAVLEQVGRQFADTVGAQAHRAVEAAALVSGSAIELASLGEAFGQGVEVFAATNQQLIESLQRIEAAVSQSMLRSDEQLVYYVAQAREVIDLSISAQQGIVEDLRRLRAVERAAG